MKTKFNYSFNAQIIQNHKYFLIEDNKFEYVYFVPINNQMLFISPSRIMLYLALSDICQTDKDVPNQIFAVKKQEFVKFVKKINKKSEFTFEIAVENGYIVGNCFIFQNGKSIDNNNPTKCGAFPIQPDNLYFETVFSYLMQREFEFKPINLDQDSLNIDLKYIGAISSCLESYKNHSIKYTFAKDDKIKVTSVNIYLDDGFKTNLSQILISHYIYGEFGSWKDDNDILSKMRNELTKGN